MLRHEVRIYAAPLGSSFPSEAFWTSTSPTFRYRSPEDGFEGTCKPGHALEAGSDDGTHGREKPYLHGHQQLEYGTISSVGQ